jgi:hypothetical protein
MTRTPAPALSTRTISPHAPSLRTRGLWLLALAVIMLALVLSACGGRAAHRGGSLPAGAGASQQSTTQTTGQDFSSDDQAIQSLMQALGGASNDANADYSSLDSPVQP